SRIAGSIDTAQHNNKRPSARDSERDCSTLIAVTGIRKIVLLHIKGIITVKISSRKNLIGPSGSARNRDTGIANSGIEKCIGIIGELCLCILYTWNCLWCSTS